MPQKAFSLNNIRRRVYQNRFVYNPAMFDIPFSQKKVVSDCNRLRLSFAGIAAFFQAPLISASRLTSAPFPDAI